jgi:Vitamin K-dependent gamma-carboxylase
MNVSHTRSRTRLQAVAAWWFQPMPRGRIAALRTIIYLFIFVDVLLTTAWVGDHAAVPGELYGPLLLGRLLPLPVPGELLVPVIKYSLLACAAIAATNRLPRIAGTAVFLLYFEWMFIAMSYGKVDHDRFAFLVALAVLPTAGAARWGDRTVDEKAGWAVRCIQVAVVLTYFLSVFAKLRFGGPEWLTSATLTRAVIRRGTWIAEPLLEVPWVLQLAQWGIVAFELAAPLLLVPGKVGRRFLIGALIFHAVTFSTITIIFLPHVICLFSFVPLERIDPARIKERVLQRRRTVKAVA